MRPHLLGFDFRARQSDVVSEWPAGRRSTYLLRENLRWPLSVDRAVWPSLFHFEPRDPLRSSEGIDVQAKSVVQLGVGLWEDRASMEHVLKEKFVGPDAGLRVAIELWYEELAGDPEWDFLATQIPAADQVAQGWQHLGYDIADRYLVSGLSNCSYNAEDRAALKEWITDINDFGLIENSNRAREFRILTDKRVPDHAPFFVYSLRVDMSSSSRPPRLPAD
jgi:hypothetical protein